MMPDLDGPATFERLQIDPVTRDIPVILLTAKLQPTDRTRFAELGVRAGGQALRSHDPGRRDRRDPRLVELTSDPW